MSDFDIRHELTQEYMNALYLWDDKHAKPLLQIYVESDIDKAFWRTFFQIYEDIYEIKINVYKYYINGDYTIEDKCYGKSKMLSDVRSGILVLNSNVLCCVDADYDLLSIGENERTIYSDLVSNNKYIIHTCWYSIENVKCSFDNIKNICFLISLPDSLACNIENTICRISEIYSDLFLLSVIMQIKRKKEYSIKRMAEDVRNTIGFNDGGSVNENVSISVNALKKQYDNYFITYKSEIEYLKNMLSQKGYYSCDYYKLMQGHLFSDYIVTPLIFSIANPLRILFLSQLPNNNKEKNIQMASQYAHQTGVINTMKSNNKGVQYEFSHEIDIKNRISLLLQDSPIDKSTEIYKEIRKQIEYALNNDCIVSILKGLIKDNKH